MSYFPSDIPFMSEEELKANGIRIPKSKDDLKHCPFCGTEAHIEKGRLRVHKSRVKKEKKGDLAYTIGCSDPECILYNDGKTSRLFFSASRDGLSVMIRRWNRRVMG